MRMNHTSKMDDKIVERGLSNDTTPKEDSTETTPPFAREFIRSRVSFALALTIPAAILWTVLIWGWFRVAPSFATSVPMPVLFGVSVLPFIIIEMVLYLNGFLREHHKLVVGGVYGCVGGHAMVKSAYGVLTGSAPLSAILLSVFFAFAAILIVRMMVRSHSQSGSASWVSEE